MGDDPASATYVKMKGNACKRVGMESRRVALPETTTTAELLAAIDALNADRDVHGILLQHPVPKQIDERAGFDRIRLAKDVDGVTSAGFGRMAMGERAFGSATPAGILRLLDHYGIAARRPARAVVLGRSPILGKPMAAMLVNRDATVTVCHSKTRGLPELVAEADLVVAAVGRPEFVSGAWIKPGPSSSTPATTRPASATSSSRPPSRAAPPTPGPGRRRPDDHRHPPRPDRRSRGARRRASRAVLGEKTSGSFSGGGLMPSRSSTKPRRS